MLISESRQFLFYHVYKVAGSSIRRVLLPYCGRSQPVMQNLFYAMRVVYTGISIPVLYQFHPYLKDVRDRLGPHFFEYYRFCFVRNPLDWQASIFFFTKRNTRHHQHRLLSGMTFDDYINWRINHELRLQSAFFYDDTVCLVDDVYRFENINQDFASLCDRLKVVASLPHVNAAARMQDTRMSRSTADRFARAFEPDYERLGYPLRIEELVK